MELRHLRYFVALNQTLSFTRAAELVHVTQSTLSHQIGQLEEELGTSLFIRDPRGLQLTPDGERFLVQAVQALNAIDAGVRSLRAPAQRARQPARIGATPSISGSFVGPAIAEVLKQQQGSSVVLLEMTPPEISTALNERRIDLGVAYPPLDADGLACERLFVEELVVMVGVAHELAHRRRIQVADLHGRSLILPTHRFSIRTLLEQFFQAAGAEPVIVAEVDSIQATLSLLKELDAAALLPALTALTAPDAHWRSIPVERPFANRVVTLYRREGELLQADAKACHAALRKAAAAVRARKRGT